MRVRRVAPNKRVAPPPPPHSNRIAIFYLYSLWQYISKGYIYISWIYNTFVTNKKLPPKEIIMLGPPLATHTAYMQNSDSAVDTVLYRYKWERNDNMDSYLDMTVNWLTYGQTDEVNNDTNDG